jgi:C-terminal processing protease CtpA/Prc
MGALPRLAFITVLLGSRGLAAPQACTPTVTLSQADVEGDLVELASNLKDRWAYAEAREHDGVSIDGLVFDAYTSILERFPGATATIPRSDFLATLERFVAELHDGHANMRDFSMRPNRRCPVEFSPSSEGVVAATAAPGLARGDLVTAVDGMPVEKRIAQIMTRTPASTATARRYQAIRLLGATDSTSVQLAVVDEHGAKRSVNCATVARDSIAQPADPVQWRVLNANIGYLRIRLFSPISWSQAFASGSLDSKEVRDRLTAPLMDKIRAAFAELNSTAALVLDLRGNTGGTDILGIEVASHLVVSAGTWPFYLLSSRLSKGNWSQPVPSGLVPASKVVYGRPLAVLIDESTFSAADNLASFLRDRRPAIFIGRPTGGGTGAPREIVLSHSCARVAFSTIRVFSPKGRMIEATGTVPDVPVQWTRADYSSGRDPDLAAAVRALGAP